MSSISSAEELADGRSEHTELDSARLPHVRSTNGADASLRLDGACPSAMMSENSMEHGSERTPGSIDLFSFAGRPHAKNTAQPIAQAAASTPTIYSSKRSASSASLDLIGLHLRTHLSSELEAMTGSRMKWRRSASPAGRSWWVLPVPRRPIGARESGLWLLTSTEPNDSEDDFIPTGRKNKGGLPDSHGKLPGFVPTPVAQCGPKAKGPPQIGGGGSGARKAAEQFFPTVTATDYGSNMGGGSGRTGKKRQSLSSLARSLGLSGRGLLASIYENMMGFPTGFLSSAALHMETQSHQSSRSSSAARSSPPNPSPADPVKTE